MSISDDELKRLSCRVFSWDFIEKSNDYIQEIAKEVLLLREKLESLLHENANMKLDEEMSIVKENTMLREKLSVAVEALSGMNPKSTSWSMSQGCTCAEDAKEALEKIKGMG